MLIVFVILIVLAAVILGLIILVQNPKGGGLSSSFGGVGNQLMGVKQTTDVLEKGTWVFASVVGLLCLTSAFFIPKSGGKAGDTDKYYNGSPSAPKPKAPATQGTMNQQPAGTPAPAWSRSACCGRGTARRSGRSRRFRCRWPIAAGPRWR